MIHKQIFFTILILVLLKLASFLSAGEYDNYGKWSEALNMVDAYENGVDPDGKKFFACQGKRLKPVDPLQSWWRERCFDDIKEEPRKLRLCNTTVACCFKFCVLERLEWLTSDLTFDHSKAHHYIMKEYKRHKYPERIIDDFIDEIEICSEWYEQYDTEDCAKNSAFVKCLTQVFLKVCDRERTSEDDDEAAITTTTPTTTTTEATTTTPQPDPSDSSMENSPPAATKPSQPMGRSFFRRVTPILAPPISSTKTLGCVPKCKELCLGRTHF